MILDTSLALTTGACTALVPCGTIQPIADVSSYLESRKAQMHWEDEQELFVTLPGEIRSQVKALQAAAELVWKLVKARSKVQPACKAVLITYRSQHWNPKTFRNTYDAWMKSKDWTVFVNRSKAGIAWTDRNDGLPDDFLDYCAARIGQYKRLDARKEALRSIKRQWQTGRTFAGRQEPIPGYGFKADWLKRNPHATSDVPAGWSYSNIMRQIRARKVLPASARALLLQGTAAAREFVPMVRGTREDLRFMEEIQFDDVKTDWRIFDPKTGDAMDLWLLIARDRATTMLLGFGMRPARARDDGSQEHLKLRDMKQLCGWLLERYGLPPYLMKWKIERGTATLSEGSAAALQELLGHGRIKISFSSMIGGNSPAGYFERRIGNSKGKASLESHNRGMHMIGASIPGQTGPHYGVRPADLAAREKECKEIALLAEFLPDNQRDQLGYGLLTLAEASKALKKIFLIQNERDDHTLEGFETVLEWWDAASQSWMPRHTAPRDAKFRKRMEMPVERAVRMIAGLQFTPVSPEIIAAFYEHTQRPVTIGDDGETFFRHEGRELVFVNPDPQAEKLPAQTKLLGYHHPEDPTFLHLTDGKGAIVGTWLQSGRVKDQDAVSQAIAHQARAMKAAKDRADELNAPEREELDSMRARNAELLRLNEFVDVAEVSDPTRATRIPKTSPVASGLSAIKKQKAETKAEESKLAAVVNKYGDEGADGILSKTTKRTEAVTGIDSGDDFLDSISGS